MRNQVILAAVVVIALLSTAQQRRTAAATGQAAEKRVMIVIMTDQGFQPNVLVLDGDPGSKVQFQVRNESKSAHGLRIEIAGQKFGLDGALEPGKTTTFEITLPARSGVGSFYSPVGNDRQKGFKGRAMMNTEEAPGG